MTLVEICVDDVDGARTAERCGAHRVEVCADLLEGGITPSLGQVATTLASVDRVGVQVLVRPRGGDFVYDADEVRAMELDIRAFLALERTVPLGFVLNALTPAGAVDEPVTRRLLEACEGAPTTFSRAFDAVVDQGAALDVLTGLGVDRVLTGGGPGTAADGVRRLRELVHRVDGRIGILAAGGIRSGGVAALVAATGVREVHLRAPHEVEGRLRTSAEEVRAVVAALRQGGR